MEFNSKVELKPSSHKRKHVEDSHILDSLQESQLNDAFPKGSLDNLGLTDKAKLYRLMKWLSDNYNLD